jgi:alkanesulfonate monooxygenase SsuD/methylene tetrahydromethanopterin reductase-like flavin-dependent oxidoreductase (luciferase family)
MTEPEPKDGNRLTGDQHPVRIGVLLWTERSRWTDLRDAAQAADKIGADSIWLSDHLFAATGSESDPCFEAWTALSALAAMTRRATIGPMVSPVALRNPGVIAKMAVTLDHISGGRSVLGLGTGWLAREFAAHGLGWEPNAAARADQFIEAIEIITGLIGGTSVSRHSRHYTMVNALHAPRPLRAQMPLLIGGEGHKYTLGVVARWADMWNARGGVVDLRRHDEALRAQCAVVGRDPKTIERLTNRWIAVRSRRRDAANVLTESLRYHGIESFDPGITAVGDSSEVAESLLSTASAGFRHIVFSFRWPFDMTSIEAIPEVRTQIERLLAEM